MTSELRSEGRPAADGPVLVAGVDGGPGTADVLRAAARLAEITHGRIAVAHVVTRPASTQVRVMCDDATLTEVEFDLFPDIVEALLDTAVPWTLTTLLGNPACELKRYAEELAAAGIVVGADTPGWSSHLRRITCGSVPARLIHEQSAPVVVIPARRTRPAKTHLGARRA